MHLPFQDSCIEYLETLAESDKHSILISGIGGSGKTWMAKHFAEYKNISTFHIVQPKVLDLKELIDSSYKLQDDQVICIENLDKGKDAAAQVILKYLEEPLPNVYIIVTCSNILNIPTTIRSRSIEVTVPNPSFSDICAYGSYINKSKFDVVKSYSVIKICKSLSDVRYFLDLPLDKLKYFEKFENEFKSQSIDSFMWNIGHFEDNSKIDLKVSLKCLYNCTWVNKNQVLNSLLALETGRISETAILGKLALELFMSRR